MQQKLLGTELYVYSLIPYVISEDVESCDVIYVQEEKVELFKELNPELEDKIEGYNMKVTTSSIPEWRTYINEGEGGEEPVEPDPVDPDPVDDNLEGYAIISKTIELDENNLSEYIDLNKEKPNEVITLDFTQLQRPTDYWIIIPQDWLEVDNQGNIIKPRFEDVPTGGIIGIDIYEEGGEIITVDEKNYVIGYTQIGNTTATLEF